MYFPGTRTQKCLLDADRSQAPRPISTELASAVFHGLVRTLAYLVELVSETRAHCCSAGHPYALCCHCSLPLEILQKTKSCFEYACPPTPGCHFTLLSLQMALIRSQPTAAIINTLMAMPQHHRPSHYGKMCVRGSRDEMADGGMLSIAAAALARVHARVFATLRQPPRQLPGGGKQYARWDVPHVLTLERMQVR